MSSYDTLSEALNGLNKSGYTIDFNMQSDSIYCKALGESFKPDDFEIVEFHRFEGNSDPADESIVYALRTKSGRQGVLVDGYGLYSDPLNSEMVQKLKTH